MNGGPHSSAIVIVALIASALLAACGGGQDGVDPRGAETNASASRTEAPVAAVRRASVQPKGLLMRELHKANGPLVSLDELRHRSRRDRLRYFISDLGTLGGTESFAYALNDQGQAIGTSRLAGDTQSHRFLYADGRMRDLFPLDSEQIQTGSPTEINNAGIVASGVISNGLYEPALMNTATHAISVLPCFGGSDNFGFSGLATSVNDRGVAVGYCQLNPSVRHGFVHHDGLTTDIDAFGGSSAAIDVNDDGVATGIVSRQPAGVATAFVYRNATMTEIFPPGTESFGRGINNRGEIVGEFLVPDGSAFHAYLYSDGKVRDLGSSDSRDTVAFAINDSERVVGSKTLTFPSTCPSGPCTVSKQFAFVWEDGTMRLLDALIPSEFGWELNWAFDINDRAQIVGYGERNGKSRAFLLTPATSPRQCFDGAWRGFGFRNQGHCVAFVVAGHSG
jgi:probable HAF family extracellular repeat protein